MTERILSEALEKALRFLVAAGETSASGLRQVVIGNEPLARFAASVWDPDWVDPAARLQSLGLAIGTSASMVSPTESGRRMVAYLDRPPEPASDLALPDGPLVSVGNPSDPVFYATILTALSDMTSVLFVDRYLPTDAIGQLSQLSSVDRILTGPGRVGDEGVVGDSVARRLERLRIQRGVHPHVAVRLSRSIHDRYALPARGPGFLIGASLGSRTMTTMIEMSEDATETLRSEHERIWSAADDVVPIGRFAADGGPADRPDPAS